MRVNKFLIISLLLAGLCSACGDTSPSAPNAMGLARHYPQEAEANFALARALWTTTQVCKDPAQAIEYLDKAISVAPDYWEAYQRRGLAKSDVYDWDGAFDDLTMAIRLNPIAENYAYRGLVSMRGGNSLGARKDLERSLSLNSKQHLAWNVRGGLNLLSGDVPAACSDFKRGCSNGDCTGWESAKTRDICN